MWYAVSRHAQARKIRADVPSFAVDNVQITPRTRSCPSKVMIVEKSPSRKFAELHHVRCKNRNLRETPVHARHRGTRLRFSVECETNRTTHEPWTLK